jgi:hypothetical protein
MFKKPLLLLAVGSFVFCTIQKNTFFKVLNADSQKWSSGASGGGSGTSYSFKLVIETDEKIRFDSIWLKDGAFLCQVVKGKVARPKVEILKNDTIFLKVSDAVAGNSSDPKSTKKTKAPKQKKAAAPIAYKGEALIRFFIGDKAQYYTVSKIKKLAPVDQP